MKKTKRKTKRTKQPRGDIARIMRFLYRWHAWSLQDKRGHGVFVAMKKFVATHIKPYEERGDKWANILLNLSTLLPVRDDAIMSPAYEDLYPKFKAEMEHLHELRDGRLNYDDMRAALENLHTSHWFLFFWKRKARILEESGASKALIGAPLSDAGEMRSALRTMDATLTAIMKGMDNPEAPLTPDAALSIWQLIHTARKALKART